MAKQLAVIDNAEAPPEIQQCPNCGAQLRGDYCQDCGPKKINRQELSVEHLFINAANEVTDLESSRAVRTFTALLFKPGRLTDFCS
jgi:hypothetical protein